MYRILTRLKSDTRGASALEYGFIAAMIVIGIISAIKGVADESTGLWATVQSKSAAAIENQ